VSQKITALRALEGGRRLADKPGPLDEGV
jgi:hypothetical protein